MTCHIWAELVAEYLTLAGHNGHHTRQDSTRTVRVSHPGADEAQHLEQYAQTLRDFGYTVTPEQATDIRPNRLRVTRAANDYPLPNLND